MWDWVPVRCSDIVESTIVSTRSPIAGSRFGDHVKWSRPAAGGQVDNAELKHVV